MGVASSSVPSCQSTEGSDRALNAGSTHADDGGRASPSKVNLLSPVTCLPLTTTGGMGRVGGGSLGGTFSRDL